MYLKLSKTFYILLIFYMTWFQHVFFQISNFLPVLGAPMVLFIILHMIKYRVDIQKVFPIEIILWIAFGLVVFGFSFFNATNKMLHISSISTYFQFLMVTWTIVYISINNKNITFFLNSSIILSIVIAITTLIVSYDYVGGRISMGPENNPNTLGITMVFAVGYALMKINFKNLIRSLLYIVLILLFTYVIVLTGSRKSLISLGIIIIFWTLFISSSQIIKLSMVNKLKYVLVLTFLVSLIYISVEHLLFDSILWFRMLDLFDSGAETRLGMYHEAWKIFQEYPIFGAGMQQFRELSIYETYTHSTYAEVLANTGIVGLLLYFPVYIIIGLKYFKKSFLANIENYNQINYRILLSLFIMAIVLGTSMIHFYSVNSFIFFGILFSLIQPNIIRD